MGTVFGACVADFFSNMARKVVDFQGLLLSAFFVPVFGPDSLTSAARVPIFLGPKYGLQVGARNTILTHLVVSASLATSAGALERFHECLLSGASAKNAARSSHAFKKNEVKKQADMRPRRRGGYSIWSQKHLQ